MTSDYDDFALDACLDEVLAQRTPPDLTQRILRSLTAASAPGPSVPGQGTSSLAIAPQPLPLAGVALPELATAPTSPGLGVRLQPHRTHGRAGRERRWSRWAIVVAASVVGLGLSIGLAALVQRRSGQVAQKPVAPAIDRVAAAPVKVAPEQMLDNHNLEAATGPVVTAVSPLPEAIPLTVANNDIPAPAGETAIAQTNETRVRFADRKPSSDAEVVSFVNADLMRTWNVAAVTPSPAIAESEWAQRVFQSVLGRAATAAELKEFDDDAVSVRRALLVERLLSDEKYAAPLARNWARVWTTNLLGAKGGQSGSLANRQELERYFISAFRSNKPFTRIAEELVGATGSSLRGESDYNPAVNFLLDGWDASGLTATTRVARALLGQHLRCAQCHEHPSAGWSQEQFWSFNSFFRQMRAERQSGADPSASPVRLVNVDFLGQRRGSRDGEVFYETPAGLLKTAFPRFLDGTEIPTSGLVETVDRRRELARLVGQSPDLPRAVVDRIWAHFFDYGLLPSVHDLRTGDPQHAALLDRLATEFAAGGQELKIAIRWIVLSDAFTRSTKLNDLVSHDMPESGRPPLFSRFYARPMATAELAGALAQAQRIRRTSANEPEREQARIDWLTQYNRASKKDSSPVLSKSKSGILADSGSSIRLTVGAQPGGLVAKMAVSQMPYDKKVEHLFWAALARRPSPRETRVAADLLASNKDDQTSALEDVWWALLNSAECVLDR